MIILNKPFLPMEPKILKKPFDDPQFGFQVKWDGIRIMAHIKQGNVILFNRKKRNKTIQYPEITAALAKLFPKNNLILDGEMISLHDGKPRFDYIIRRDFSKNNQTIKYLMRKIPVQYIVFDVLYFDNEKLLDLPFKKRDDLLKNIVKSRYPVVTTDTFNTCGISLFKVIKKRNLEGIVAKKLDSPYIVGTKTDYWLKIKNWRKINTFIGGFISQQNKIRSLLLGIFQEKKFLYIGRAASGLNEIQTKSLHFKLNKNKTSHPPFANPPIEKVQGEIYWVKPLIKVKVEYIDFTEKGQLRHPRIINISV